MVERGPPVERDAGRGPLFAGHMAQAALCALRPASDETPTFDDIRATEDRVEPRSDAGPITAAPGDAYDHWTDVPGFEIDGGPAERAEILDGRVRIHAIDAPLEADDAPAFGTGGGTGTHAALEDVTAGACLDMPIADHGPFGPEAVGLAPVADTGRTFPNAPGTWVAPVPLPATVRPMPTAPGLPAPMRRRRTA